MKIDRLLGVISVLAAKERITIQKLAERFEVSKRTIFRDLDTLNKAGIPIVSYSGMGGGISIVEGYKLDRNILLKEDRKNIFIALNGLNSIHKSDSINHLMAKLIPAGIIDAFDDSDYMIDLSSWFQDSVAQEKILQIHGAITDRKCIRLEYISRNSHSERTIQPYKLVFKQSCWYLYAFCELKNAFRLFKVNRVASYEILDTSFSLKSIDKIDFPKDYGADLFTEGNNTFLHEVVLEYHMSDEFYLTNKIDAMFFHKNENGDLSKGEIRFRVSDLEWATDLIFSLQDRVKILSPVVLIDTVKSRLNNINNLYKGDI